MIDKLSDLTDAALTISLHAPNDVLRNELVPINKKYSIEKLLDSGYTLRRKVWRPKKNYYGIYLD